MKIALPKIVMNSIDRSLPLNGRPFDLTNSLALPKESHTAVHYGIMIPSLPAPHRFLDIIVVVGQSKLKIFRNQHLIKTSAIDTAALLIGTGTEQNNFKGYSIEQDCDLHSNDGHLNLRFGKDVCLSGKYPNFIATRSGHTFNFELKLTASDKVAHFAKLIFDQYDHYSILCKYDGYVEKDGAKITVNGLCTFEYARGTNLSLPFRFFTYQILNIDEKTQVLLVEVLGPFDVIVQQRVYVRSLDDHGQVYSRDFRFEVHEYLANQAITPEGFSMKLPKKFTWSVNDDAGNEIIYVEGMSNNDFCYGMAAGYAGSYTYKGRFKGKAISGDGGYIENIDYR